MKDKNLERQKTKALSELEDLNTSITSLFHDFQNQIEYLEKENDQLEKTIEYKEEQITDLEEGLEESILNNKKLEAEYVSILGAKERLEKENGEQKSEIQDLEDDLKHYKP